jgi:hypothetical protein
VTRRNRPEDQIQRALFEHIRLRGMPGLVAWHTPNGGARSPIEAAIFKSIGVRAGIPDVLALHEGRLYGLELKATGNKPTLTQTATMAALREAGATVETAIELDAALEQIEAWGLLRGSCT